MAKWKHVGYGWTGSDGSKGGEAWELRIDEHTRLSVESYSREDREIWNCYIERNGVSMMLEGSPRNRKEAFKLLERFMGVEIAK